MKTLIAIVVFASLAAAQMPDCVSVTLATNPPQSGGCINLSMIANSASAGPHKGRSESPCECGDACNPRDGCGAKHCVPRDGAKSPRHESYAVATLAHYRHDGSALLNDLNATPGAATGTTKAQLCSSEFRTGQVRNVSEALKRRVYAEYGAIEKKGICCEVDHLISLELGGSNDIKNLWPQPYAPGPGAHEKDALENYLHREVCSGAISLGQAQDEIRRDWYEAMK